MIWNPCGSRGGMYRRRADRAGRCVHLRLAQVERVRALDLARRDVVADRVREDLAALSDHDPDLGLGDVPGRVAADPDRLARPHRAPRRRVLQEQLRSVGLVDEVVDVLDRALAHPRVPAALVRDARAPHLGRIERRDERPPSVELQAVRVDRCDRAPLGGEHLAEEERHRVIDPGELPERPLVVQLDADRHAACRIHPADDPAHQ